jgi:hypothetical protein
MPTKMEISMGLAIVGYPAIAASAGLLLAKIAPPQSKLRHASVAAATGAGLITSFVALNGWQKIPPVDSLGWVPVTTAAATVIALVLAVALQGRARIVAGVVGLALAASAALYFAGKPIFAKSIGSFVPLGIGGAILAGVTVLRAERVSEAAFNAAPWIARIITASAAAGCAMWSSSALLAMLIGSSATTAGAIGIGSAVLRLRETAPLAHAIWIAHVSAIAVYAYLFAAVSAITVPILALLAASLLAPSIISMISAGTGNFKSRIVRSAAIIALATAFAGGAAGWVYNKTQSSNKADDPANMYK